MTSIDQELDNVPKRIVGRSGGVVAAMIVASIFATIWLARCHVVDSIHPAAKGPLRIETTLFERATEAEIMRVRGEQQLQTYGWVDRATGTIHVPLDVAIDQYLGEQR
jgi:hypothetical protein